MIGLTVEQQDFLMNRVRRGMSTIFARELAKTKGEHVDNLVDLHQLEEKLDLDWKFIDYKDAGLHWRQVGLRCKCGRMLRYQFTVLNRRSGEVCSFGKDHFEEHVGIPATVVRDIKAGFDGVDYELDDLLNKIRHKWTVPLYIPNGFDMPNEFMEYLRLNIPLLDRHIDRLGKMLAAHHQRNRPVKPVQHLSNQINPLTEDKPRILQTNITRYPSVASPQTTEYRRKTATQTELNEEQKSFVMQCLGEGTESISDICAFMIAKGLASNAIRSNGKPHVTFLIAGYLYRMQQQGKVKHIGNINGHVRYRLN
jgi:hypothetical protein